MTNQKVTIIIPAYNTADFIGDMLDCVVNQTYQNLQIIVINDGSNDDTEKIIQEYQMNDDSIEYILADHGGVSNARNLGIERACGEKIFFWDSDDIIELNAVERCLEYAKEIGVNSVLYGYSNRSVDGVKGEAHQTCLKKEYRNQQITKELMPSFLGHSFEDLNRWIAGGAGLRATKEHTALWRIMLHTETIRKGSLKFDPNLSVGEDTRFINEYFLHETDIGVLEDCLYYLTIRPGSANETSMANPNLMAQNKIKLINARLQIDAKAMALKGIDTHCYWEGTLILSAIQLAIKFSKNRSCSYKENLKYFLDYLENETVQRAIRGFQPQRKIKAIPFRMIRNRQHKLFFALCSLLPKKISSKFW